MYTTIEYGLREKGKDELVTYNTRERGACYLGSGYEPWLVDDFDTACYAKWVCTEWYNADYEHPVNPLETANLEVVKVVTTVVVKESELEDEIELVNKMLKESYQQPLDDELVTDVLIAEDIRRQEEGGEGNELYDDEEGEMGYDYEEDSEDEFEDAEEIRKND